MKTLHQSKYSYLGVAKVGKSYYHTFQSQFEDKDPELVMVPRARMIPINNQRTSIFFDPISETQGNEINFQISEVDFDEHGDDVMVFRNRFTVRKENLISEGAYSIMKVDGLVFGLSSNVAVSQGS